MFAMQSPQYTSEEAGTWDMNFNPSWSACFPCSLLAIGLTQGGAWHQTYLAETVDTALLGAGPPMLAMQ